MVFRRRYLYNYFYYEQGDENVLLVGGFQIGDIVIKLFICLWYLYDVYRIFGEGIKMIDQFRFGVEGKRFSD